MEAEVRSCKECGSALDEGSKEDMENGVCWSCRMEISDQVKRLKKIWYARENKA